MNNIRILIADDHAIVREGLRTLISSELGMEMVGEATNGNEAVQKALALNPDVILMDLVPSSQPMRLSSNRTGRASVRSALIFSPTPFARNKRKS